MPASENSETRHKTRLLKLLSKHRKGGLKFSDKSEAIIIHANKQDYSFAKMLYKKSLMAGQINQHDGYVTITHHGMDVLKQTLEPNLGEMGEERKVQAVDEIIDGERQIVMKNINESPLSRLYFRKTKQGTSYISISEFEAGERLRKDFERGQLQPKISASLQSSIGRSGKSATSDISDFALDARARVNTAIEKLGPELGGAIVDICCFLKGLELIERERKWPPRSAKLMLKTGLAILARHYGLSGNYNNHIKSIQTWGTQDYRPNI